jgi:hypothetical protein
MSAVSCGQGSDVLFWSLARELAANEACEPRRAAERHGLFGFVAIGARMAMRSYPTPTASLVAGRGVFAW